MVPVNLASGLATRHQRTIADQTPIAPPRRRTASASEDRDPAGRIRRQLASRIGPHKFEMWFGNANMRVDGDRVEISTGSPFVAKWIETNFADDLRTAARDTLGRDATIDVRVDPDLAPTTPAAPAPAREGKDAGTPPTARKSHGRSGPALRRLGEFVVGPSNRLAYSTACRVIEEPDAMSVSPLFIHGECGLGKTHLLQGICHGFSARAGSAARVRYVTGEQFTNEYIASIRKGAVDSFRSQIRKLDLLAIDDVHFLSNKVGTQGEFLHTLDAIDLTGSRVVLASDEHPRVIKRFSQALISRFLSGVVVKIDRPDRDTRLAIVQRLATTRGISLHPAAIEAVASRCVGSIRELEGAVTKLAALHSLLTPVAEAQGEIGIVLVEQLFNEHGWQPPTPVRIGTIIDVISDRLGVSRADLMGGSRHRRVVLGRALVAYLGRDMTTHSYPEIARALGRKYHSTIHTAEQRLRRQISAGERADFHDAAEPLPIKELVDQLRHEIARANA